MSEPFIAEIKLFGGNFAPRGYAFTDGQLLPISQNSALFSLVGTTYGGDGRTTFGLPEMRGRTPVHPGNGPGLSQISWGQRGGIESHTLTVAQMPSHNHNYSMGASSEDVNSSDPAGNVLGVGSYYTTEEPDELMRASAVSNTGGNQSYSIRNPYIGIYHIIALQGIFPSRS